MSSTLTSASQAPPEQTYSMPIWLDDDHVDPSWIRAQTGLPCRSCHPVKDISNATRRQTKVRDGATLQVTIELDNDNDNDDQSVSLVIKQVPESGLALSRQLGLAREALFYHSQLEQMPAGTIPKIYYAAGDMESGAKLILMEDLSNTAVDSGVFFGPGNPNNLLRDLPALARRAGNPPPSTRRVAEQTFRTMARVHAMYWRRSERLLDSSKSWLRGQAWLQGQGGESWEASQQLARDFWRNCIEKESSTGKDAIRWDPLVKTTCHKAVQGISWEAQQQRLNVAGHWTLVHGDFWPGNVMWMIDDDDDDGGNNDHDSTRAGSVRLLDWEMVGLGSGPQDLGQYILSNMDPQERKACERELVQIYFDELQEAGVDVSWEYCWSEYVIGGLERWLWFLVYFVGHAGLETWAQFFHDQIAAFMHDHELTAADIVQPRP
jgi:aminoglycoside phosphotransferase (APT) family kinase protein